mgnify:CR=1 FL=1
MLLVALTGGIGAGKSEAGGIFQDLGAVVVDSDQLSRDVIERGTSGFDEVVKLFGDEILKNGEIDRKKLSEIVFSDREKLSELEKIIHPRVREAFEKIVHSCKEDDVIINQIPLLVETDGAKRFDKVIVVTAPIESRRSRLLSRGMKSYEIDKRLSNQASDEARNAVADYVLDNSGTKEELLQKIEKLYLELKAHASNN